MELGQEGLIGINRSLKQEGYDNLASKTKLDPREFVNDHICSIRNYYNCCEDTCENCPGLTHIQDILVALK